MFDIDALLEISRDEYLASPRDADETRGVVDGSPLIYSG